MNKEQAFARAFLNILHEQVDTPSYQVTRQASCQPTMFNIGATARLCDKFWHPKNILDIPKRG